MFSKNIVHNVLLIYCISPFSGKNVLNQKSELERALSKHKEKQVISQQEKEHKKAPGKYF